MPKQYWTQDKLDYIKANLHLSDKELGCHFSKAASTIKSLRGKYKILKGINTQFKPGHTPANKGKKISAKEKEKYKHTFYQKGHKPHNTKYDGYIGKRTDTRTGITYKVIRISKNTFKHLHVHNWEKANGPVPEGFIVAFKTSDTMNCEPENLELITRAENMKRNSFHI